MREQHSGWGRTWAVISGTLDTDSMNLLNISYGLAWHETTYIAYLYLSDPPWITSLTLCKWSVKLQDGSYPPCSRSRSWKIAERRVQIHPWSSSTPGNRRVSITLLSSWTPTVFGRLFRMDTELCFTIGFCYDLGDNAPSSLISLQLFNALQFFQLQCRLFVVTMFSQPSCPVVNGV